MVLYHFFCICPKLQHNFQSVVNNFCMKTRLLSKILDNIFLMLSVFCVSFLWIRYREHNIWLILIFSSLITFFICTIFHMITLYKQKKNKISSDENKKVASLTNHLMFQTKQDTIKDFERALLSRSLPYKKYANYLEYNDMIIYPIFYKPSVDDSTVLSVILSLKSKRIIPQTLVVCSKNFTTSAKQLCDNFSEYNIALYNEKTTYQVFFKPVNIEFEPSPQKTAKKSKKEKFWNLVSIAFNKQRFKGYFFSSIVLIIASYFMRYNLYYLITSSILILFAIFSYFNKPFNPKQTNIFGE